MTGFYYDDQGMGALEKQLDRLCEDFGAAGKYVDRYTDLGWVDQGLIMRLIGPHEKARANVLHVISTYHRFAESCVTAVDRTLEYYDEVERANQHALATLRSEDAHIKGASNPHDLDGLAYNHDKGLPKGISWRPFNDVEDAAGFLTMKPYFGETGGDVFWTPHGTDYFYVSTAIRLLSQKILHRDVFDEATELFAGSWGKFYECGVVWMQLAKFFDATADNLRRAAADTSSAWRGNAAEAAEDVFVRGAREMTKTADGLRRYEKEYKKIVNAVKESFPVIESQLVGLVNAIQDAILAAGGAEILLETVVGSLALAGLTGYYIACAVEIGAEVVGSMNQIKDFVDNAKAVLAVISVAGDPPKLPDDLPGK